MANELSAVISDYLSDSLVEEALRTVLEQCAWELELDGKHLVVDPEVDLFIIERSLYETELRIGFGSHIRVLVAIGGIDGVSHGVVTPRVGFALAYFSLERKLITVDFMPIEWWVR